MVKSACVWLLCECVSGYCVCQSRFLSNPVTVFIVASYRLVWNVACGIRVYAKNFDAFQPIDIFCAIVTKKKNTMKKEKQGRTLKGNTMVQWINTLWNNRSVVE